MDAAQTHPDLAGVRSDIRIEDLSYKLSIENLEGAPREIRLGGRDRARLLVVERQGSKLYHSAVNDLPQWMEPGDVLVLNNSKRIPGVLKGRTPRGGQVELRFIEVDGDGLGGLCRVFPMHDLDAGSKVAVGGRECLIEETKQTKYNLARVTVADGSSLRQLLIEEGRPIAGFFYEGHWSCEHLNPYYAIEEGGVESPLAGLHFTPELVTRVEAAGVEVCFVTLHSVGSWLPFLEEEIEEHEMWAEQFVIPEETAAAINRAHQEGGRVFCCGSTSLRAIESAAEEDGAVNAMRGRTNLYVTPGYTFRATDAYFTNFHQYQTSLIVLDAAFGGTDLIMDSYRTASDLGYSFFEFGDAVLIV